MLSSFVQDGSFCSDNSDQCAPWAVYNMFLGYYGLLTTYWCVLLLYRTIHIPNFSFLFNFNMYFNAYYLVYSEDLSEVVNHGPLSPSLHCWYCRGSAYYPIWLRLGILGMNGKFYYPPNKGRVLWPLWLMGVYGIIMYNDIRWYSYIPKMEWHGMAMLRSCLKPEILHTG